jgi:hypothetical protein
MSALRSACVTEFRLQVDCLCAEKIAEYIHFLSLECSSFCRIGMNSEAQERKPIRRHTRKCVISEVKVHVKLGLAVPV